MKGDFTRDTFDRLRHFSRVLMQQGRVQLDADFNEQAAILLYYLRTAIKDLIGPCGAIGDGFKITAGGSKDTLVVGKGRYYVEGILCENEDDLKLNQEELEAAEGQRLKDDAFLYLDVWERHVTFVQDGGIREVALGGPDTCTRSKVVWRIRIGQDSGNKPLEVWLGQRPRLSNARIRARVRPEQEDNNICSLPPESRYRGAENQLYRIEIHRGGLGGKETIEQGGKPSGDATFKWSRDNGSIVFPIVRQEGAAVTLQSLGRDQRTSLKVRDWVEIMDDDTELRGAPGIMAQVDIVDPIEMKVTLKQPDDGGVVSWPSYDEESTNHPLVRRWDHCSKGRLTLSMGAIPIVESADPKSGWIEIEDGIEVQFVPAEKGARAYQTGDYWLIPARAATGKIEWPEGALAEKEGLPPHGVEHHYAPLAMIQSGSPEDRRPKMEQLAKL